MKIAVAAVKKEVGSDISGQAGRAPYYLVFNESADLLEVLKNPFRLGGGGAGFGVAKMLADRRVDAAVAEKFGPKIMGALKERGIRAYTMKGAAKLAPAKIQES